jgi:hypothetical protein
MVEERDAVGTAQDAGNLVRSLRADIRGRLEALATTIDRTAADSGFRHLLSGMARLWRYSVFNQVWIAAQREKATAVAGRKQWEAQGRVVRDGEKSLSILAPSRPGRGGWPFLLVEVFDISQTDGPAPPPLASFNPTRGECPDLGRIEAAGDKLGIKVETVDPLLVGEVIGAHAGFAGRAMGGKVQIIQGLTPLARASTLAHEYAHELLHDPGRQRHPEPHSVRETEAEATAFVVMEALGYRVEAPTYIAWQGGKGRDILKSMSRIAGAIKAILTAVEGKKPRVRIPQSDWAQTGKRLRPGEIEWHEGPVNVEREHIEIYWGPTAAEEEGLVLVARLGPTRRRRSFVVDVRADRDDPDLVEAVDAVRRELDFYLLELEEQNPWAYACYHCSTAANLYGHVHWALRAAKGRAERR